MPAVKILVFDTVFANDTFSFLMINKHVGKYSKVAAVALERFTVPSGIEYGVLLIHHCHFITTLLIMVVQCIVISDYLTNISHSRFTNNSACKKRRSNKTGRCNFTAKLFCCYT